MISRGKVAVMSLNPYEAPQTETPFLPESVPSSSTLSTSYASFPKTMFVWTVVCGISAIPGFIWGIGTMAQKNAAAMGTGILVFILFYVAGDYATRGTPFRTSRSIRLTLRIGYWSRLVISILFPIGMFIDVYAGMIAVNILGLATNAPMQDSSFLLIFVMTLVTGMIINVGLAAYMSVVFGVIQFFQFVLGNRRSRPVEG